MHRDPAVPVDPCPSDPARDPRPLLSSEYMGIREGEEYKGGKYQ